MHIPDGFLATEIWAPMWLLTIAIIGYAIGKTNRKLPEKNIPLLGVLAAFVFAAQMLNAPVAGGTSGHLLGGVLSAIILGPMSASVVMASVFIVQGIFFQDGGITALGANIFNMGFIGTIGCYYIFYIIQKAVKGPFGFYGGAALAAWLALVLASAATAIEISLSGTVPMGIVLPAMVSIHSIIGFIEAGVTLAVLSFLGKTRPDLLKLEKV
jgi:cobalt/nickel transport system permease protein